MPTGYTSKLYDGEDQTFPEFAMSCAHAFGALVELRDSGIDAEVPEEFTTHPYHLEQLRDATARLNEALAWTTADADAAAEYQYNDAVSRYEQFLRNASERRERYTAMLLEVEQWGPPTDEHSGLKDFMVQQLSDSMEHDCSVDYYPQPVRLSGEDYRKDCIAKAQRDIAYHTEEQAKDEERARGRTEWVRALRRSLVNQEG